MKIIRNSCQFTNTAFDRVNSTAESKPGSEVELDTFRSLGNEVRNIPRSISLQFADL